LIGLGNEKGTAFTLWDLFSFLAFGETDRKREVSSTSIRQSLSGIFMVADEDTAIRCLLEDANIELPHGSCKFPDSFWQ
jgi:hypothetical protein